MTTTTMETRMGMFKKYLDKSGMEHKDYQYDGVRWCLDNELRAEPMNGVRGGFIADEMGLGKTILMIGLTYSNFVPRTLIVVPPVLIDQWFLQIYKTAGHKALIYHANNKKTITLQKLSTAPIVITTYGAIGISKQNKDLTMLHKVSWGRIIFDEAHHLRNHKTNVYKGARLFPAKIKWLVSGTPVQNNIKDFYSLCALIGFPPSFFANSSNLKPFVRSFILRRTKKQVGIIISDILVDNSIVNWSSQKEMELSQELHSTLHFSQLDPEKCLNTEIVSTLASRGHLSLMLRAKQSCVYPKLLTKTLDNLVKKGFIPDYSCYKEAFDHSSKLDAAVNAILKRKGNGCGKLIFCHFHEEIDEITNRLRAGGITTVATFDGRISHSKRGSILAEKNEALVLQIQTGCEGLNLQENYSEIYFISPHWNPAVEDQAIARCHRIGQTKPVYVVRFQMSSFVTDTNTSQTIDNYVIDVQEDKRRIGSGIFG